MRPNFESGITKTSFHRRSLASLQLLLLLTGMLSTIPSAGLAQTEVPDFRQETLESEPTPGQEPPRSPDQKNGTVPESVKMKPQSPGQYVLEFNRSPIVGTRLQLRGIYDEARLRFTRPRNWATKNVKVALRFRHSAALYATRSNLTVMVNGSSVGSVPLNKKEGELGTAVYNVPAKLLQDYNEVVIAALQNNSPTCTQDPFDPSLWTEVMPDSKIVFDFEPKPVTLDFSRYPYPLFDNLSLNPNQMAYLLPEPIEETWLTAATRFHTALGRFAQYRPVEVRLVKAIDAVKPGERLIIIGTPKNQPALKSLNLPLTLENDRWLDEQKKPLPDDVGVLMLAPTPDEKAAVLIATGNTPEAAQKAAQFLVQSRDRQISTGRVIFVRELTDVPSPPVREWDGYLPLQDTFKLKDLKTFNSEPYQDVTVRGADAPPIEFDFRALPDDKFSPGNVLNLKYSYGPQLNPLTSLMEVQLDGLPIAGKKLDAVDGVKEATYRVEIPENKIRPNSKIQVRFQLDPRERRSCNRAVDQQLWGTVHADSDFELKRENLAQMPDLKLLQAGYPFAAPQDLSRTAIVVPRKPSETDLLLLLKFGERLGRLTKSESLKLEVFRADKLPSQAQKERHLVAIGTRDQFPLPDALKSEGFALDKLFERQRDNSRIRTLPDPEGVAKQILSPWNRDRVLLILTGQTEAGLKQLHDVFNQDSLFYQLREDTALISANDSTLSPYDPNAYTLEFLQRAQQRQTLSETTWQDRLLQIIGGNWLLLIPATLVLVILLYGVLQASLDRHAGKEK